MQNVITWSALGKAKLCKNFLAEKRIKNCQEKRAEEEEEKKQVLASCELVFGKLFLPSFLVISLPFSFNIDFYSLFSSVIAL